MSVAFMFALVGAGLLGWWLFARQLTAKPWDPVQRVSDDDFAGAMASASPQKVGLWLLLAVITSLFGLLISAYAMRIGVPDWRPAAIPPVLWLNTAVLAASSVAFEWSRRSAARRNVQAARAGLLAAGVLAIVFIAGQLEAWQQLRASGQLPSANIGNAFFYLMTGLHVVHLLGGLTVWSRTVARAWSGSARMEGDRLTVELCATYWHFLLIVWLVLFGILLSGTTTAFLWHDICSALGIGPH